MIEIELTAPNRVTLRIGIIGAWRLPLPSQPAHVGLT